ncbi:single-stranded DNA-binding protein, partial [Enterococcus lactis]|uniref:single-stranded DNA-binding protein n=3 Tax=Enterococcus TaxID=1350 RepID=UPI0038103A04
LWFNQYCNLRETTYMRRADLFYQLINELDNLLVNDEFMISDMFKGFVWKKVSKADRLWLGREFLNKVKNNEVKNIKIMEKTSSNKQMYKKI